MKGTEMKTIRSVIFLSFLIILLLVTPVIGSSDDWVEYIRDDGDVYSYYKVIIQHKPKDIVRVWTKMVFSDESREKCIQHEKQRGLSTKGWDKLSEYQYLQEIDCKKKRFLKISIIYYDTDGNILYTFPYHRPDWDYIIPDTRLDILRKKVCK
jgi:hypothetical protein